MNQTLPVALATLEDLLAGTFGTILLGIMIVGFVGACALAVMWSRVPFHVQKIRDLLELRESRFKLAESERAREARRDAEVLP